MNNITFNIQSRNIESNSITVVYTHNGITLEPLEIQLSALMYETLDDLHAEIARAGYYAFQGRRITNNTQLLDQLELNKNINVSPEIFKPIPMDQVKVKIREVLLVEGLIK